MGQLVRNLLRAFFPPVNVIPSPPEVPPEVRKTERVYIEDTQPLEKEILMGPLVTPEEIALGGLAYRLDSFAKSTIEKESPPAWLTQSYHLSNGWNVDVKISRPYVLRMGHKGEIMEIHPRPRIVVTGNPGG